MKEETALIGPTGSAARATTKNFSLAHHSINYFMLFLQSQKFTNRRTTIW